MGGSSVALRALVVVAVLPVVGLLVLAAMLGEVALSSGLEVGVAWTLALAIAAGAILTAARRARAGAIALVASLALWLVWVFVVPDTTAPPAFGFFLLGGAALLAALEAWGHLLAPHG